VVSQSVLSSLWDKGHFSGPTEHFDGLVSLDDYIEYLVSEASSHPF